MKYFKKKLVNYLNAFFDEKAIEIMCYDLEPKSEIYFYLELQCYPPIGALIKMDQYDKLFKIESLEIQNTKGTFCVAKGVFIN